MSAAFTIEDEKAHLEAVRHLNARWTMWFANSRAGGVCCFGALAPRMRCFIGTAAGSLIADLLDCANYKTSLSWNLVA